MGKYFLKDGYFSVTSTVDHPTINNSLFANVKVKDADCRSFPTEEAGKARFGCGLTKYRNPFILEKDLPKFLSIHPEKL